MQDDVVAFEVNLAVKGDVTIAMWFTDHFAEVSAARNGNSWGSGCASTKGALDAYMRQCRCQPSQAGCTASTSLQCLACNP